MTVSLVEVRNVCEAMFLATQWALEEEHFYLGELSLFPPPPDWTTPFGNSECRL